VVITKAACDFILIVLLGNAGYPKRNNQSVEGVMGMERRLYAFIVSALAGLSLSWLLQKAVPDLFLADLIAIAAVSVIGVILRLRFQVSALQAIAAGGVVIGRDWTALQSGGPVLALVLASLSIAFALPATLHQATPKKR
jgi:hypothetical protein